MSLLEEFDSIIELLLSLKTHMCCINANKCPNVIKWEYMLLPIISAAPVATPPPPGENLAEYPKKKFEGKEVKLSVPFPSSFDKLETYCQALPYSAKLFGYVILIPFPLDSNSYPL